MKPLERRRSRRSPVMVLLVDDQAMIGEAVRRALANHDDIDFHFCSDGLEALDAANLIKPTVILQDLVMPDIEGIELVRQYRANPSTAKTPVIVLSVKDDPAVKLSAFDAGANDYLVKIPDPVELLARIRYHAQAYTSQMQLDEAMRALRESQQQLLDSNTVLLSLNQKLEAATRAKSDFLAMMSHEIRTPLNAVMGFSDLLSETDMDSAQRDYVETIRSSGRTLLTVINDVLDFSKIEAGKLSIEEERFNVLRCVREACELFEAKAAEGGTLIRWDVCPSLPACVSGDSVRIRQVLTNLISNAVKFTRAGQIHVHAGVGDVLELARHSPEVDPASSAMYLRASVRDNGPGILEEKRELLFQSFSQINSPAHRRLGGTGLGLAICKRLCQLMGGDVWHLEAEGGGAEFVFMVRVAPAPAEQETETPAGEEIDSQSFPMLFRDVRVVVAEDNAANAKLIHALLRKQGLEPVLVSNGREAVQVVCSGGCDLIFMDVQMPVMDGLDATRAIRRWESDQHGQAVFIVALTAEAMQGDDEKCIRAGMDTYLSKPIRVAELRGALMRFLTERSNLAPASVSAE